MTNTTNPIHMTAELSALLPTDLANPITDHPGMSGYTTPPPHAGRMHTIDPFYGTPVPIAGDTPADLIDLQHETWAYELKLFAERPVPNMTWWERFCELVCPSYP